MDENNVTTPETDVNEQLAEANAKLQDALAELAKQKRATDKASAEAADFKKKYRATLDENEQKQIAEAEKKAADDERFKAIERENSIYRRTEDFLDEGFSTELAKKAAIADVDGDRDTVHELRKQALEATRKAWEADFIKSRPDVNIGSGSASKGITKEQFDKMGVIERTKLYETNKAEYDRLMAL